MQIVDPARQVIVCHIGTDADGTRHASTIGRFPLRKTTTIHACSPIPHAGEWLRLYFPGWAAIAATLSQRKLLDGTPSGNLLVALRSRERVIGYISVDNLVTGHPIVEEDALPLVAFANGFAASLEISPCWRAAPAASRSGCRCCNTAWSIWRGFRDAAGLLGSMQDLESVLDTIYSSVREGLNYESGRSVPDRAAGRGTGRLRGARHRRAGPTVSPRARK